MSLFLLDGVVATSLPLPLSFVHVPHYSHYCHLGNDGSGGHQAAARDRGGDDSQGLGGAGMGLGELGAGHGLGESFFDDEDFSLGGVGAG